MRRAIIVLLALAALAFAGASTTLATKPDPEHKVAICHRTASDTNPYVYIEVDEASLDAHFNNLPGHPAKEWKSDGTYRGFAHSEGDLKQDYLAEFGEASCSDSQESASPSPSESESASPSPTSSIGTAETATPTPRASDPARHDVPNTAIPFDARDGVIPNLLFLFGLMFISAAGVMAVGLAYEKIRRR